MSLIIAIYVNNLIIVYKDLGRINKVKKALNLRFNIKDLGKVKNLLSIKVHCFPDGSVFIN